MRSRPYLLLLACLGFAALPHVAGAAAPIATTDGESPETRIEVQELKRQSGGTLMLKFTVVNDSDRELNRDMFSTQQSNSADGLYVVDLSGKKKYEVIRDSEKHCVCSGNIPHIKPKTSLNLWAKFPAPAEAVDKVGVVVPHFIPLDDVPISK